MVNSGAEELQRSIGGVQADENDEHTLDVDSG